MPALLNILLSLAFAGGVGAAAHYWRIQLDVARREGMQALAARRGWALTVTGERLGRAGTLRLVPRGGLPWAAESRPRVSLGEPATEYEAEEPFWAEGTLILIAAPLAGASDGEPRENAARSQALTDLLGEEMARLAETLRPVAAPEGVTALSNGNPALRADIANLSQAMTDWVPVSGGPRGVPVLILSPAGLRLRLRRRLQRPEQMERFLDLALELSRLIGP